MAFYETIDHPVSYVWYLVDHIRGGIMYLPDWKCPEDPFHDGVAKYAVRENDVLYRAAAGSTVKLLCDLQRIAPHWEELNESPGRAGELLDEQSAFIWNTYVRPFETEGMETDQAMEILSRAEDGEELTEEESVLFERCSALARADAVRRRGKDTPFAYEEIFHAMRYCRLAALHAPRSAIHAESLRLTQYVLLSWCAVGCETL